MISDMGSVPETDPKTMMKTIYTLDSLNALAINSLHFVNRIRRSFWATKPIRRHYFIIINISINSDSRIRNLFYAG